MVTLALRREHGGAHRRSQPTDRINNQPLRRCRKPRMTYQRVPA
jgi:hypothetical protein